jgi:2-oxoglutarate/2-oxoacid ferredoxin oxidoreductase subunit alpha
MMTRDQFRFDLIMDAGNGAQKAGDILIKGFANQGLYVYIEPMIPAEISPPKRTKYSMSGVTIRVATGELTNIGSLSELMLVEQEILLDRRLDDEEYEPGGTVILDMGDQKRSPATYDQAMARARAAGLKVLPLSIPDEAQQTIRELNGNGKNMVYLGVFTAIFNITLTDMNAFVSQVFKKLPADKLAKNLTLVQSGYDLAQANFSELFLSIPANPDDREKILMDGNTALAMGIVDSGIKLYSGYPITPASSIMHTLAKSFPAYGGIVHQAEDEIAAIGTAIGSYFGGVPAITATSGPGLSLKQEFIGLAMVSEIPCIVIDVQRGGPSTGLPTRTEQSDLFAAAFGTHGDATKVVLSVSSVEDCFYAPHIARYLTEKLRVPVLILSDYLTSVSYKVFEKLNLNVMENISDILPEILERFYIEALPESIEMVKTNQSIPGEVGRLRRVTGLNTDIEGTVAYTSQTNQRAHQVRNEKLHHVRRALKTPEFFGPSEGDLLVVAWGSSRGVLKEAIDTCHREGVSVSGMHLKMVYPLPLMLKELFSRFKRVVTIETVYGDSLKHTPFSTLLRSETLLDVKAVLSNATGRPLKPSQVVNTIKELSHVHNN